MADDLPLDATITDELVDAFGNTQQRIREALKTETRPHVRDRLQIRAKQVDHSWETFMAWSAALQEEDAG